MSSIQPFLARWTEKVDRKLNNTPAAQVIAGTAAATAVGCFALYHLGKYLSSVDWQESFKLVARQIPYVQEKLETERAKLETSVEREHFVNICTDEICFELPENGWSREQILQRLETAAGKARSGKNSGAYYIDKKEIDGLIAEVNTLALRTNPLHTDLCPLIKQLENEVVSMCAAMFHGGDQVIGSVTTGGTDSIRHAVFTARERAKKRFRISDGWELVVPKTIHPAFEKAANEYCIKIIKVPVHPQGHPRAFQVDIEAMEEAISSKTILAACSCPGYPQGIIDPVNEIAEMLASVDPGGRIGLHADYCLGGFILPWMDEQHYGFDIPRVTSISCDTHKYGYTEKGSSVVMYRDYENWFKYQIYTTTDWAGGIYATPTLAGSRAGKDIAATWAVMAFLGKKGYKKEATKVVETAKRIAKAIAEMENVELLGNPIAMNIAFQSTNETINIYDVKKEMCARGWYLAGLQKPAGLHLCVTAVHANIADFEKRFISDLKESINAVKLYPIEKRGKSSDAAMYRSNIQIGEREFVNEFTQLFWLYHSRVFPHTVKLQETREGSAAASSD